MAAKRDYYELLGVSRTAGPEELKRAYRKLAVRLHPDHNPEDRAAEDAFKEISEAYAVLSNAERRKRYDRLGHSAFADAGGMPPPDFGAIGDMLEGLFGDVFGRRGDTALPRDLRYELEITFEEAALGVERSIHYERKELCRRCEGKRFEPSHAEHACPACKGRGEVRYQRGFFAASRPCSACEGTGVRSEARCVGCHGSGTVARSRDLSVRVPAGVADGAVRSVRGAGDVSTTGSGDLHVHIHVKPHPLFTRDGADVLCEVPVSFPEAALGAEIDVPTITGKVSMRLPPGTQSGRVFRLRGKGLPVFGGAGKGDELVRVTVEVPAQLDDRQREALAALAKELERDSVAHPRRRGFLDKLKELFE